MALYCCFCGLSKFRTSRFRFQVLDLSRVLLLRLPVRCLNCDERSYAPLWQILKLRSARRARHREHNRERRGTM
jgi:hypothetical protein